MSTTEVLVHLVEHYDDSPLVQGRRMEDLCRADEGEISSAAAQTLKAFDGSRGFLHLLRILSQRSMIQPVLLMLAAQDSKAVSEVTRAVIAADPLFDALQLLRNLLGPDGEAHGDAQARADVLAALAAACQNTRLFPIVSSMLKKTDAAFNSRVVLSIGRAPGTRDFLFRQTEDPDPRVCANSIEAMWEHEGAEVEQLLQKMRRRGHPRIVANSLIGLYRLGSLDGLRGLVEMGRHPSAAFRVSAAWAMGFLADARFTPVLKELLKEPTGPVRRHALMALQKVQAGRQASARLASGGIGVASVSKAASGAVGLRVVAWDPEECALLLLRATQWTIQTGGLTGLLEYTADSHPSAPLRTAILAPFPTEEQDERLGALERAFEAALGLKRAGDGLAVFPYRPLWTDQNLELSHLRRDEASEPEGLEAFWRPWRDAEVRTRWLGPLKTVLRNTVDILARHRGPRHVVLVVDGASADRPSLEQLVQCIELAAESGVTPHVALIRDVDGGMGPQLEAAVAPHNGWLAIADNLEDLGRCLSIVSGGAALHYRIEFQPPAVPPGLAPPPSIIGYLTPTLAGSLALPLD